MKSDFKGSGFSSGSVFVLNKVSGFGSRFTYVKGSSSVTGSYCYCSSPWGNLSLIGVGTVKDKTILWQDTFFGHNLCSQ